MKWDKNLASIHAYICADGYVIKNPSNQKQKYYYIGFRNTNKKLLNDFQKKFYAYFKIKPRLILGERCIVQNKAIYEKLSDCFGSFYSREWKMPKLNKGLSRAWVRSFFDCEGWVFCKSHQNRHIGLDSVNEEGINQIISALDNLGIKTIKKSNPKRGIFRILIYGKDNLIKFEKEIGFLHPDKYMKLKGSIKDYVNYEWEFPDEERKLDKFVKKMVKKKMKINRGKYLRMTSKSEKNLLKLSRIMKRLFDIESLIGKRANGLGSVYHELNINKKEEVMKLIKLKLVPNLFK